MSSAPTMRIVRTGAAARRNESGWVLAASLILSTLAIAVTVTYARHAVLAKKSLEFAQGASPVEEATRSGMERVRERMLDGNPPGTVEEGTQDHAVTAGGEDVTGERQVLAAQMREIRVRATSTVTAQASDEFNTRPAPRSRRAAARPRSRRRSSAPAASRSWPATSRSSAARRVSPASSSPA